MCPTPCETQASWISGHQWAGSRQPVLSRTQAVALMGISGQIHPMDSWAQDLGKHSKMSLTSLADILIYLLFMFSSSWAVLSYTIHHKAFSHLLNILSEMGPVLFLRGGAPFTYSHKKTVLQDISTFCRLTDAELFCWICRLAVGPLM